MTFLTLSKADGTASHCAVLIGGLELCVGSLKYYWGEALLFLSWPSRFDDNFFPDFA